MATRWQGMGSKEAAGYATERKDYMDSSFKAGKKQGKDTIKELFKLGILKKGFDSWLDAGTTGLMNETINRTLDDSRSINTVLDQMNPFITNLTGFENDQQKIIDAGYNVNNDDDLVAYYWTKASGDMGTEFANRYKMIPKESDIKVKKGMLNDFVNKVQDKAIKEKAEKGLKYYTDRKNLFRSFEDPDSGMPLTTSRIQETVALLRNQITASTDKNLQQGQYVNPQGFDSVLYRMGITDGDLRKNVIQGVKDETIEDSLKRRLDFKIRGTAVDEDFERLANSILTNWERNSHLISPDVKDKILTDIAIENNPNADPTTTTEDVTNAKKNLNVVETMIGDFPERLPNLGIYLEYADDAKPLSAEERKASILSQMDELGRLQIALDSEAISYDEYILAYNDVIYDKIGLYTFKEAFNDIGDKNIAMLQDQFLGQVSASGWDTLTEQQQEFMSILYPNAFQNGKIKTGSARSKIGNNTPNTTTTDFIENTEELLTNELNVLTRNFDGSIPLSEVVNTEADKRIENGELRQSDKEAWMSQRTQFLQTEILSGGFENQLQIMKSALAGDPAARKQMAVIQAQIQQQYYDAGYYDQIAVRNMSLADTLASFYGIKGEPGIFGQPNRVAQGIRTPRMQVGRGSKWAELLNVKYTDIYSDANKRIDDGAGTYRRLDTKAKKDIGDIFLNLTDWENGKGIYADDYVPQKEGEIKIPASYRMQDKVLRYATLRKYAEVLSKQPSKDSELTNRIEKAIVSSDKLTTEGRNDFNDAYIQLRSAIDSELTMFNVAFGTRIQASQQNVVTETKGSEEDLAKNIQNNIDADKEKSPETNSSWLEKAIQREGKIENISTQNNIDSDTFKLVQVSNEEEEELFGGRGLPTFNTIDDLRKFTDILDEKNYTLTEKEKDILNSEIPRLLEIGKEPEDDSSILQYWDEALLGIATLWNPIKKLNVFRPRKWKEAKKYVSTKVGAAMAKVGANTLKGKNVNVLKANVDAALVRNVKIELKYLPKSITNMKDVAKRKIAEARWLRNQTQKDLYKIDPKDRLAFLSKSKWYNNLSASDKVIAESIVKSNSYKHGGKVAIDKTELGWSVLQSTYRNQALRGTEAVKKYGPTATTVGAGSLLAKKIVDNNKEEDDTNFELDPNYLATLNPTR